MANKNRKSDRNRVGEPGDTTAIVHPRHHEVLSTEVPRHSAEELGALVDPVVATIKQMARSLLGRKAPASQLQIRPWSLRRTIYVDAMGKLQESYAVQLGQVADVQEVKDGVAVAKKLGPAIVAVEQGLNAMKEAYVAATRPALAGARRIYNRAKTAAETHGNIAAAIAPFREPYIKAAKKGHQTRKTKTPEKTAPTPAPTHEKPVPAPIETTTVTKTTKR